MPHLCFPRNSLVKPALQMACKSVFACKTSEKEHTARILVPGQQYSFPPRLTFLRHHFNSHIKPILYAELLTEVFSEIHLYVLRKRVIYEDNVQEQFGYKVFLCKNTLTKLNVL